MTSNTDAQLSLESTALPPGWDTDGEMVELAKLLTSPGAGQFAVGVALAWIILNLHLLKARAKDGRAAAEKLTRELIGAVEKRAQEDREVVRQNNATNAAEHAALTAAVHGLAAKVDVLLDRIKRPEPDEDAD